MVKYIFVKVAKLIITQTPILSGQNVEKMFLRINHLKAPNCPLAKNV